MVTKRLKTAEMANLDDAPVNKIVTEVLNGIREEGEKALRYYSEKYDKWSPNKFRLSEDEIEAAGKVIPEDVKKEILFLNEQVTRFARAQKATLTDFEVETFPGVKLGQKYIPINSVGVYVPGGRYRLIASSQMSIVPARVAGVKRIVACTPARAGQIDQLMIYSIGIAGADEIYVLGGAQAIGAMAYGVDRVMEPVDMIAGPGNKYVVEAKRQVFGTVGIDLLPGPTEIGLIIDESADPSIVAADVLAQAEHDPDTRQIVITTSEQTGIATLGWIEVLLKNWPTAEISGAAWSKHGEMIYTATKEEAVALANEFAPEHLEIHCHDLDWFSSNLVNYGSLFLGEESSVVYSDKAIGTNHILPTNGAARYTGGLWVGKYMKNVTYQRLDRRGSLAIAPHAAKISNLEGMLGHERSVNARIEKYSTLKLRDQDS
jgi:sulfopropanediol 3-dehydrogenase